MAVSAKWLSTSDMQIYIKTQMGESEPMDLPFLLSQSRIFRASSLTPDEKLGYVAYIHLVSAIF
jgi:hypothetical protein